MNNSWVKLYRKINLNSIMADPVALQLFIWILTNVDSKNGTVDFGRYLVARQLRVNPNTLYSALKRLVSKYKVCEISSTTEYSRITLLNWAKYQPSNESVNTSVNNKSTTTQQSVNTYTRNKNKNIDIHTGVTSKTGLIACSEDDLLEVSRSMDIPLASVKRTHAIILNKIEAGEFKNKTVYHTLKNWLLMDVEKGFIKHNADDGYRVVTR